MNVSRGQKGQKKGQKKGQFTRVSGLFPKCKRVKNGLLVDIMYIQCYFFVWGFLILRKIKRGCIAPIISDRANTPFIS